MDSAILFLTGAFPFTGEFQNIGMALEGAIKVRKGPNKDGNLHWFHAFMLSVVAGFAGGIFNFIWLGKPSSFFANDLAMGSCLLAFAIVNLMPFDIGFLFSTSLPVSILITSGAQLFRSLGVCKFATTAFLAFKDNPSPYYPIPVFGPIMYATLLGNMGGFFMKGFEGHVGNGVPWPVQNGLFCATFYLFYAKDQEGSIGNLLRTYVPLAKMLEVDDETFAVAFVSLFMQIMGILQMPEFLGPTFTPFGTAIFSPSIGSSVWNAGKQDTAYAKQQKQRQQATKETIAKPVKLEEATTSKQAEEAEATEAAKRKKKKKGSAAAKEKEL